MGIVGSTDFTLEKAVETADGADGADRQGLEVKRPRNCEVTPKPSMDSVVQPLHLRNRRHLRLNELPVLGSMLPEPTAYAVGYRLSALRA